MAEDDDIPPTTQIVRHLRKGEADAAETGNDTDDVATQVVFARSERPIARVVVMGGHGAGQVRLVYRGTNAIGRERANRIALDFGDPTVSRRDHAILVADGPNGPFRLIDGGKVNPVVVNGRLLRGEAELKIGDTIEVGTTTLLLQGI